MKNRFGIVFQDEASGDGENGKGGGGAGGGELTQENFDKLLADNKTMKTDNANMQTKMGVLLDETKKAKTERKEAEDLAREAADKKAHEKGNFEELYNSSEKARTALQEEYDGMKGTISKGKCKSAALAMAADLADGDNAKLLATFIEPRLKESDGDMRVTDDKGGLTVSTLDDLKAEFQKNKTYASLLRGSQGSGGGAPGGKGHDAGGASDGKQITRADFDKLDDVGKMKFSKSKGKIVD